MGQRRRWGFTLVELLVVIGILAVLVGLLFPVLSHARRKAQGAKCQSNLRQIGLTLSMYAQDNDGLFPLTGNPYPIPNTWRVAVFPYVRNAQLLLCPTERMSPPFDGTLSDCSLKSGYAMNAVHWQMGPPNPPGMWRTHESFIELPAETIHVVDGDGSYEFLNPDPAPTGGSNEHNFVRDDAAGRRHSAGANYLFCDGHVKHLKPSQVHCAKGRCDWSIEDER
jgi:prepilin-type processing-associated H-X9-DG protein/prepilin-type N-terminal cleavage/methylation domain-containing protein